MTASARIRALVAFSVASLTGQNLGVPPWVRPGGIFNAAGRLPVNLPGGALAPGALIAIDGLRFDPSSTTVEIEKAGRIYPAEILHATPQRILAKMPDGSAYRSQAGSRGKLFVVSHGKRSVGADIPLAASAFGIFTANGEGWGAAASLEGPTGVPSALPIVHPGKEVTLSGTGLGHAQPGDIDVFVGGCKASHIRRYTKNGIDKITFRLPTEAPRGCAVPVTVAVGSTTSNTAILPIAAENVCAGNQTWFDRTRSPGERSGTIVLLHSDVILELAEGKPVHFMLDNLLASFMRHGAVSSAPSGPLDLLPPSGSCIDWAGPLDSNQLALPWLMGETGTGLELGADLDGKTASLSGLDAGPELMIEGPDGTRRAVRSTKKPHLYSTILGGNPPLSRIPATPLFLSPGSYRIGIPGGSDVGPATTKLDITSMIQWQNREAVPVLNRSAGAALDWTLPSGYTAVVFAWSLSRRTSSGGFAVCLPPLNATHFRIPSQAVANLPPTITGASDLLLGFIGVAAVPVDPPAFHAQGLDQARAIFASLSGRSVMVK